MSFVIEVEVTRAEMKRKVFYSATYISMAASANTYLDIPNYGLLRQEFGVTEFMLGLMTGLFLIAFGLSSVLWAYLNDRLTKRRGLLTFATTAFAIATFFVITARSFDTLLFLRVISGIFLGAVPPVAYSLLVDVFELKERVRALYLWSFFSSTGSAIGFGVATLVGGIYGWRGAFAVGLGMMAIASIISARIIEPPRGLSEEELEELIMRGLSYPYRITLTDLKMLPRDEVLKCFVMHAFFSSVTWGAFGTWAIHMLNWEKGLSYFLALGLLTAMSLGAILSVLLAWLLDWLRMRNPNFAAKLTGILILAEMVFYILFLALIPSYEGETTLSSFISWLRDRRVLIPVIFGALGMALGNIKGPFLQAAIGDLFLPEHRATVMAMTNIFTLLGRSIGILLAGALASYILGSLSASLIFMEIFLSIAAFSWLSLGTFYGARLARIRSILEARVREELG